MFSLSIVASPREGQPKSHALDKALYPKPYGHLEHCSTRFHSPWYHLASALVMASVCHDNSWTFPDISKVPVSPAKNITYSYQSPAALKCLLASSPAGSFKWHNTWWPCVINPRLQTGSGTNLHLRSGVFHALRLSALASTFENIIQDILGEDMSLRSRSSVEISIITIPCYCVG